MAQNKKTAAQLRRERQHQRAARARRLERVLGYGALIIVTGFVVGLVGLAALFWHFGRDLPTVESLRNYQPEQITRVYDREGVLIGELSGVRRTVVPLSKVPRVVVLAILAAEDADFYRHRGLDYPGILRALYRDFWSRKPMQGASTITQQVVKNLLLTHERTIRRKVRELILARRLEQELEKDEILHLYINNIYFGHGRYGIEEAAQYYFGKGVDELSLGEATLIAGIPQAPARLSPRTHPKAARRRKAYILDQLERKREVYWPDLELQEIDQARDAVVRLTKEVDRQDAAPELMRQVRRILVDAFGEDAAKTGGYRIYTTIDLGAQNRVREALRSGLREFDKRHGLAAPFKKQRKAQGAHQVRGKLQFGKTYDAEVIATNNDAEAIEVQVAGQRALLDMSSAARYNPKELEPERFATPGAHLRVSLLSLPDQAQEGEQEEALPRVELATGPQGAVVALDPATREVLALVGGYKDIAGFDRATQALRQPGSAFKPIVYARAIQSRSFTPATLVLDAPEVFDKYQPRNYETWNFEGSVRLRYALAKSINLVAIRVIEKLGPENVVEFARDLGISSELDANLPLALGASEVTPLELANAFAVFAAGGVWEAPKFIKEIRDAAGQPVELPEKEPSKQVLSAAEAYVITSMMTSVVRHGTAGAAQALGKAIAGKTGTSNRARDAWFVGYTPHVLAAVWVGYDDNRPLGRGESGGSTALPIWMDAIRALEGDRLRGDFPVPPGVERAKIDPETGKLAYAGMADAIDEVFLEGTVPTEIALAPGLADTKTFLMEQLEDSAAE